MAIRLCDEDRARFGCAEWLDFSPRAITIGDLEELSERFGFDPDDWPTPFFGELTLEQAGDETAKPKPPRWQKHAWAWLLLRQNGCPVSWEDASEVHFFLAETNRSEEEPGKDEGATLASPPSEASTTAPSPSSSD